MSKVVHLDDEAHALAKAFCKKQGVRMSDWVADLIAQAVVGTAQAVRPAEAKSDFPDTRLRAQLMCTPRTVSIETSPALLARGHGVVPKKRLLPLEYTSASASDDVSPYEAPPFWEGTGIR